MAITIISSPAGEPSVQDDLWHIAASDNSGSVDMRYVFDVWVNGSQQIRVKQYPDPVTGQAYFNAGPIVRNGFSYQWFTPVNAVDNVYLVKPSASGEISQNYQVRYGEDVSGITSTNMASGETTAYNWIPPVFKRRTFDSTIKINRYLTNRPLSAKNVLGQKFLIPFSSDEDLNMEVDTYDHNNTIISNYVDPTPYASGYVQVDIGRDAINARLGVEAIHYGVKYYDVSFVTDREYRIYNTCSPKYTTYNLYFLNAWGMFDTAQFSLVSKLTKDMERKAFTERDYRQGSGAVTYYDGNGVYHESKINYANKADHSLRLTMDAPTDAEWQWLAELISSPQIYMEQDGYFYPVTIKNTNYEYNKYVNIGLRAFEIDLEINQTRWSQLR